MVELFVFGGLVAAGLAVAAVLGFVFFLIKLAFWLVLLPFRLLLKAVMIPVWLTLGALGLAAGAVALPVVLAVVAVVGALGILQRAARGEKGRFVEQASRQLDTDWQWACGRVRGQADGRQPGQVRAHREHIAQVHLNRVRGLLAEAKRRGRRSRHRDDVAQSKGVVVVLAQ